MSEPGDSSDGNRRKAVLHSDGYRTGCTRCSLPLYRARRQKIGQHNGAHFYTIGQRKGLGIGGRKESLFVLATDVEQNVIYVGEGDNHPGLYRRALRIAPGELHWIDPLRELKTGESRRFDVRIRYRQPLQGAELFIRPDAAYLLSTNLSVESRRDSSQPGTMAMSWSDRASSPNNRTFPDSVQATAAEEEAHKHGPFYRNPGKTGDKQSSQPSAPRSKYRQPSRTVPADFRQAFPSQAPFHKEAKERDSPEHAPGER